MDGFTRSFARWLKRVFPFVVLLLVGAPVQAAYQSNIDLGLQWLRSQQNADGSWGTTTIEKFYYTLEVVDAFASAGAHDSNYYRGIAWLENHAADNHDFDARIVKILTDHGDNMALVVTGLKGEAESTSNGYTGCGLNTSVTRSPLDTAKVWEALLAYNSSTENQAVAGYLKSAQLSGAGWPLSANTTSDAFSTAWAVKALAAYSLTDSSITTAIANGIATLQNKITSTSPIYLRGMAAQVAVKAGYTTAANTWLSLLKNEQSASTGAWNSNMHATAAATRAMAVYDGLDSATNRTLVNVSDAKLRRAINLALGHNAMDALTRLDLSKLTTLSAVNLGISDLTGLEYATNLTSLDVRNNQITSTDPLKGLTLLTTILLDGNPAASVVAYLDTSIPTLPEWGMLLLTLLLLGYGWRVQQSRVSASLSTV